MLLEGIEVLLEYVFSRSYRSVVDLASSSCFHHPSLTRCAQSDVFEENVRWSVE